MPCVVDVMKAGGYVALRGARVDMFRSSMRLVVDQRGSVEPVHDVSFQPKVRHIPSGVNRRAMTSTDLVNHSSVYTAAAQTTE